MIKKTAAALLLPIAAFLLFKYINGGASKDRASTMEQAVRDAALQCYALEGAYPASMDYLYDHYGLNKDSGVLVYYEYIASNLMPQITVVNVGR